MPPAAGEFNSLTVPGSDQDPVAAAGLPSGWRLAFGSGRHGSHSRRLSSSGTLSSTLGLSCWLRRNQSQTLAHFRFNLGGDVFVVFEELSGILAALADPLGLVAEP